ncbi:MAG TPA: TOBE domain-containing protein [Terriglobales bacterium]|nr:TOBE domain-containing protein [Terriglobales bacterium]
MKISARNALPGTISRVTRGAVNSEVDLSLKGGENVVAIITNASVDSLGLKEGKSAYAIFKASSVMMARDLRAGQVSARNILSGTIQKIQDGAVNCEVTLKLAGGSDVVSIITKESVKSLGLKTGDSASAVVKASNVMIGVDH